MTGFRLLLGGIFLAVALYTVPVLLNHGLTLFEVFFGDIAKMGWPGQFNMDFMGFLLLSGVWTAWRNQFAPAGLALALVAFFFGAPFLTAYLLYLSAGTNGDIARMLLGDARAAQLRA